MKENKTYPSSQEPTDSVVDVLPSKKAWHAPIVQNLNITQTNSSEGPSDDGAAPETNPS